MASPSKAQNKKENRKHKRRTPFEKTDWERNNVHSPDIGREEIAKGDPQLWQQELEEDQREPWKRKVS